MPARARVVASRPEPPSDCVACPRLAAFRHDNAAAHPDWFNKPVPSFGPEDARFLIVGLAPGLKGANKTGRPFTGDYAGDLLYATLEKYGFSNGRYQARPDDGLELHDVMITNAVRCVPPQNKPTGEETRNCLSFFNARLAALPNLSCILALGKIAHDAVLNARELKKSQYKFAHGASHDIGSGLTLFDSYHCSRYNTNTGRLTEAMFHDVFDLVAMHLKG